MKNPIIKQLVVVLSAFFFVVWLWGLAVNSAQTQPVQPDTFMSPLKKGQNVTLKETPAGYRITLGLGTHKIVACENDYVVVTDAAGVNTIRINKNALLSITIIDLKLPK